MTTNPDRNSSRQAAAAVVVTVGLDTHPAWPTLTLQFGAQVDTKPILRGDGLPGAGLIETTLAGQVGKSLLRIAGDHFPDLGDGL